MELITIKQVANNLQISPLKVWSLIRKHNLPVHWYKELRQSGVDKKQLERFTNKHKDIIEQMRLDIANLNTVG